MKKIGICFALTLFVISVIGPTLAEATQACPIGDEGVAFMKKEITPKLKALAEKAVASNDCDKAATEFATLLGTTISSKPDSGSNEYKYTDNITSCGTISCFLPRVRCENNATPGKYLVNTAMDSSIGWCNSKVCAFGVAVMNSGISSCTGTIWMPNR